MLYVCEYFCLIHTLQYIYFLNIYSHIYLHANFIVFYFAGNADAKTAGILYGF